MKTLALVTAFPPSTGSLNEYGLHLVQAFARRTDIDKVIVIADKMDTPLAELDFGPKFGPKIDVHRIWEFNDIFAGAKIIKTLNRLNPDSVLYNLQTASFGDQEIPAALGLLTPAWSHLKGHSSGVLMHNLIDAVDLSQTHLSGQYLRQKLVSFAGTLMTKAMLKAGYMSVTLDSFHDILTNKYKAKNAFMVPHGSFPSADILPHTRLNQRDNIIVTMGKFGTYKKLNRMISAVQNLNTARATREKLTLIIGGTDHPATPGYLETLAQQNAHDPFIKFHGYVAEEDVEGFFKQAKLAVFDYDSTTGSSGVLHQAAIYGTPPIYPLMGDFIDVTQREGLSGFHYIPLDQDSLETTIAKGLELDHKAQATADNNLHVSKGVTLDTVAAVQLRLLRNIKEGHVFTLRQSQNQVMILKERMS